MLEGQKRKSARILALNKRKQNQHQQQQAEAEASQKNVAHPRRGRKRKRLVEVADTNSLQDLENPKHENPRISSANLPSLPPMPEKRILEFVLDILQRRDTHELFGQPVDPEEVEDYDKIIKEPMDFGTIRAKLQEEMYKTLEQFEYDVFLIPKNAMHFNSSATIYFRQARAINELAKRVFHILKLDPRAIEHEFSLQKSKLGRKPHSKTGSSRTKLATDRGRNIRACHGLSSSNNLVNQMDIEILSGSRDGRDPNSSERRQTCRPWTSLCSENESIVSTVYKCYKQLVPGNGEIGYTESLLQFVKDLGPTAQKVAGQKLARCLTGSPNYHSRTPACSLQNLNSQICSSSAQRGPTPMSGIIGSQIQIPCIVPNLPGNAISTSNANDQLGIRGAVAAKGKSVLTTDENYVPHSDMITLHSALHGERARGSNRNVIGGALQGEMVANTLRVMGTCAPSRGMIQLRDKTDHIVPALADDACLQNHNIKNQLALTSPVAGIEGFNSCCKYLNMDMMVDPSQLRNQVQPAQLALGSHSQSNSAQASQLVEWGRPTPWGPQAIYDFHNTEAGIFDQDAFAQPELQQFTSTRYTPLLASEAIPFGLPIYAHQEPQHALALYGHQPNDVNPLGQAALLQQELLLAQLQPGNANSLGYENFLQQEMQLAQPPNGLMFNIYAGIIPQSQQAGTKRFSTTVLNG